MAAHPLLCNEQSVPRRLLRQSEQFHLAIHGSEITQDIDQFGMTGADRLFGELDCALAVSEDAVLREDGRKEDREILRPKKIKWKDQRRMALSLSRPRSLEAKESALSLHPS